MKYEQKLENFTRDLDNQINFLGYMCCGTCARGKYEQSGHKKSFWISSDDIDNKASQGVDIMLFYDEPFDIETIISTATKHNLSFYFSMWSDRNQYRIGVYSKRGKQEIKFYVDGKEIEPNIAESK